jgi:hypothetical protein
MLPPRFISVYSIKPGPLISDLLTLPVGHCSYTLAMKNGPWFQPQHAACRVSLHAFTRTYRCSFKYIGHSFIRKFNSLQGAITAHRQQFGYSSRQPFGNPSSITVIPSRRTVELFSCIQARDSCDLKNLSYQLPQPCQSSILSSLIQKIFPIKLGGSLYLHSAR